MAVLFEKVSHLGSRCFRYVPFLTEVCWTPELREFYEEVSTHRQDLAVLPVEACWAHFLGFYTLVQMRESAQEGWLKVYRLKPGVAASLPAKVVIAFGLPETQITVTPDSEWFESKPSVGRMSEFVLVRGELSFNEGTRFDPDWQLYRA